MERPWGRDQVESRGGELHEEGEKAGHCSISVYPPYVSISIGNMTQLHESS